MPSMFSNTVTLTIGTTLSRYSTHSNDFIQYGQSPDITEKIYSSGYPLVPGTLYLIDVSASGGLSGDCLLAGNNQAAASGLNVIGLGRSYSGGALPVIAAQGVIIHPGDPLANVYCIHWQTVPPAIV